MALWQMRFDNTGFQSDDSIFGSQNYTVAAEDMPDFPLAPKDIRSSVGMETDSGDIFKYRKFFRTQFTLRFVDVSEACMATMRNIYIEDVDFLFFEDSGGVRTYNWLPNGTATCTIMNEEIEWTMRDDRFNFDLIVSSVQGTKNE